MRKIIGIGLAIAAVLCVLLLIQQSAAHHTATGAPAAATLAPFEMMKEPGKHLPVESWPAH
jgi:hypothetical protein